MRTFFRVVVVNANTFAAVYTTPNIFLRCGLQRKKIIAVVGNNAEKHT
jgi:hypothetical protein